MINAGVFALQADAPHWQGWADLLGEALQRSTDMTDQIALNVLVYDHGFALRAAAQPLQLADPSRDAGLGRRARACSSSRPCPTTRSASCT